MSTVAILVRNTIVKITNPFLQCEYLTIFVSDQECARLVLVDPILFIELVNEIFVLPATSSSSPPPPTPATQKDNIDMDAYKIEILAYKLPPFHSQLSWRFRLDMRQSRPSHSESNILV